MKLITEEVARVKFIVEGKGAQKENVYRRCIPSR